MRQETSTGKIAASTVDFNAVVVGDIIVEADEKSDLVVAK